MSTSKFLAGALAGLIVGLLLAPDKGQNTRDSLTQTAQRLRDHIYRISGRSVSGINELRQYLRKDIDGLPEDVRNRILTILDEAEEMAYRPDTGGKSYANGAL